jgi:hypothetical protein
VYQNYVDELSFSSIIAWTAAISQLAGSLSLFWSGIMAKRTPAEKQKKSMKKKKELVFGTEGGDGLMSIG